MNFSRGRSLLVLSMIPLRVGSPDAWAAAEGGETGVRLMGQDQQVVVQSGLYTAKVNMNGALSSLVIEGVEFIAPPIETVCAGKRQLLIGLFACPQGQWFNASDPAPVREQTGNVVRCEGNGWKLTYTFGPDTIDLEYEGTPTGAVAPPGPAAPRGFKAGYPPAELMISLSPDLDRACDPGNQGELGWPVNRQHEPGTFAVLAKNGAGFIAEGASHFHNETHGAYIPAPPHRFLGLVYHTNDTTPGPVKHRLKLFRQADLAHAVTMQIQSPNRQHLFSNTEEVPFAVSVQTRYGQQLQGTVRFQGAPFVWKTPELTAETPLEVGPNASATVVVKIRPPKPGHYTGQIQITDGSQPIYSQRLGFMYQPEKIPAAEPPPGFDAFWDKTLAELEKVPLDLTLEEQPAQESAAGKVYKAKFRSWGGRWAWAWLYVPKREQPGPGRVRCPAVSYYQPGQPQTGVDELRIDAAVHGGDLKDFPAKPDFDYMSTGITSRETYAMRYGICCLVRCFDILKKHPLCNGEITIEGGSQGAGLAMCLAGLREGREVVGRAVAWCRIDWTVLGYAQWGPRAPEGTDRQQVAEVVRYFDPASFAHRIRTPLRYAIGLFDYCAPAEGIFTAFNALPKDTPCQAFVDPYGGHFTIDVADFNKGEGIIDVPRWYGTDAENKLNQ